MNLCFIKLIGKENDGRYAYEFFFSEKINDVEINNCEYFPSCLTNDIYIIPSKELKIKTFKTSIKLDLIQDNCCFSFLHAKIGCIALAVENMDTYETYPENGRLFFMFGESLDDVERKLAMKNILMLN